MPSKHIAMYARRLFVQSKLGTKSFERYASTNSKVPKSLLLKQEKRLTQSNLSAEELKQIETQKLKNQTSQLLITSLKDISGYFNPGGATSNEDDLEAEHFDKLRKKYENGYLDRLLKEKFGVELQNSDILIASNVNEKLWASSFENITFEDLEILNYYLDVVLLENYGYAWSNLPKDLQRLLFYRAYGSYGPRNDLENTFATKLVKPQDFLWLKPSPSVFSQTINISSRKPHKLNLISDIKNVDLSKVGNGLINIYECSDKRFDQWKNKFNKADPGSKFVLYLMGVVSLFCLYKDKQFYSTLESSESDSEPVNK
ncbi:hypothetical protein ACO0RG_003135 [Hanseniaspora osmophila]|uniref:Genetic interactor of prohibitin 7, mitochondrial n=1 Tax=Hanseniaspora osmophila TaxID=56408 RepID=A0A1E5RDN4_9ASCO|nr:Genetic interactor of prohibitin 7, mitochondrial [Hanseniaspora osmophila]